MVDHRYDRDDHQYRRRTPPAMAITGRPRRSPRSAPPSTALTPPTTPACRQSCQVSAYRSEGRTSEKDTDATNVHRSQRAASPTLLLLPDRPGDIFSTAYLFWQDAPGTRTSRGHVLGTWGRRGEADWTKIRQGVVPRLVATSRG